MRHRKRTTKLNRTSSHRRCMMANMLKALITHGRITTTEAKAKVLKMYADKMVTLAKKNTLASRRRAIAELMVRRNPLTSKEARRAADGAQHLLNDDRQVIDRLWSLGERFAERQGGYTRLIRAAERAGDASPTCIVEYLPE